MKTGVAKNKIQVCFIDTLVLTLVRDTHFLLRYPGLDGTTGNDISQSQLQWDNGDISHTQKGTHKRIQYNSTNCNGDAMEYHYQ